jgi:hypothetical protein
LRDDDQDFWLDLAAEMRWSKAVLRQRVRASVPAPCPTGKPAPARTELRLRLERRSEQRWRQAADRAGCP